MERRHVNHTATTYALPWGSATDVKNLEAHPVLAATEASRVFRERAVSIAVWCVVYARRDGDEPGIVVDNLGARGQSPAHTLSWPLLCL